MNGTDLWVLVSLALSLIWMFDAKRGGAAPKTPLESVMMVVGQMKSWHEPFATLCLVLAATDFGSWPEGLSLLISDVCSFEKLYANARPIGAYPTWLGGVEPTSLQLCFLQLSMAVWRAEKFESTMVRLARSVQRVKEQGVGTTLQRAASDPMENAKPTLWGIGRRVALIVISSCGFAPFMQFVFPTILADEFLCWLGASLSGFMARWLKWNVPVKFDMVVIPIFDLCHFIPVLIKVAMLALLIFSDYSAVMRWELYVVSGLAWTAHNCHLLYSQVFVELPEVFAGLSAGQ